MRQGERVKAKYARIQTFDNVYQYLSTAWQLEKRTKVKVIEIVQMINKLLD